jgi:hypothetical protein
LGFNVSLRVPRQHDVHHNHTRRVEGDGLRWVVVTKTGTRGAYASWAPGNYYFWFYIFTYTCSTAITATTAVVSIDRYTIYYYLLSNVNLGYPYMGIPEGYPSLSVQLSVPMSHGYGYWRIRVRIGIKIPMGYPCPSLFILRKWLQP